MSTNGEKKSSFPHLIPFTLKWCLDSNIGPAVQEKIYKFKCILLKAITCAKFPWICNSVLLEKNILQFVNVFSLVAIDYTCVYPFGKGSTLRLNVNKSEST